MSKIYHAIIEANDDSGAAGIEWHAYGLDRAKLFGLMRAAMTRLAPLDRWEFCEHDDDLACVTVDGLEYETYIADHDLAC